MENALLTKKDISSLLNMCPKSARIFLERNGIFPINVGNGKIPRLRWSEFKVKALLDTLQQDNYKERQLHSIRKYRKQSGENIFSQSASEIMQALQYIQ